MPVGGKKSFLGSAALLGAAVLCLLSCDMAGLIAGGASVYTVSVKRVYNGSIKVKTDYDPVSDGLIVLPGIKVTLIVQPQKNFELVGGSLRYGDSPFPRQTACTPSRCRKATSLSAASLSPILQRGALRRPSRLSAPIPPAL